MVGMLAAQRFRARPHCHSGLELLASCHDGFTEALMIAHQLHPAAGL